MNDQGPPPPIEALVDMKLSPYEIAPLRKTRSLDSILRSHAKGRRAEAQQYSSGPLARIHLATSLSLSKKKTLQYP